MLRRGAADHLPCYDAHPSAGKVVQASIRVACTSFVRCILSPGSAVSAFDEEIQRESPHPILDPCSHRCRHVRGRFGHRHAGQLSKLLHVLIKMITSTFFMLHVLGNPMFLLVLLPS